MCTRFLNLAIFWFSVLVSIAYSETNNIKTDRIDISFFENLAPEDNRGNDHLIDISNQVNEWYPHVIIGLLEADTSLSEDINHIIVKSHYLGFQGEVFWLLKHKSAGTLDNIFLKTLIARRASSVIGAYPISLNIELKEQLHFVTLISDYWNMNQEATLEALKFNFSRWTSSDALLPIIFLTHKNIDGYEEKLEKYNLADYQRLKEIVEAIIKSKETNE